MGEREKSGRSPHNTLDSMNVILITQVSTLVSLGQVQTEEGYSDDAVNTYLQILGLQEDEDPDEVADAHFQVRFPTKALRRVEGRPGKWGTPDRLDVHLPQKCSAWAVLQKCFTRGVFLARIA